MQCAVVAILASLFSNCFFPQPYSTFEFGSFTFTHTDVGVMASSTYSCGRCRQALTLRTTSSSESLLSIRESQYDLLASQIQVPSPAEAKDRGISALLRDDTAALLHRKVIGLSPSSHIRQTAQQKLFDNLSSASEVDYPLCGECAESWAASMGRTIQGLKLERELLTGYEKEATGKKDELEKRNEQLRQETALLEEEERQLIAELLKAESEKAALEQDSKKLDDEERELEREEAE